ncbi:MAG: heparinase II/III domain-containing protein [Acidimicrobiales bacterium]
MEHRSAVYDWLSILRESGPRRVRAGATYRLRREIASARRLIRLGRRDPEFPSLSHWPIKSRSRALATDIREDLAQGVLDLRGETIEIDGAGGFGRSALESASRLANFDAHGWEWSWYLCQRPSGGTRTLFDAVWKAWIRDWRYSRGDAWHPFVVSSRIWVLLDVFGDLVKNGASEPSVLRHLDEASRYLDRTVEWHHGGNHILKNLKALVGVAFARGSAPLLASALLAFEREAYRQILGDGGHIERSPSYHVAALADMLDVLDLVRAAGTGSDALESTVERARRWVVAMRSRDGNLPPFNDSSRVSAHTVSAVGLGEEERGDGRSLTVLSDSGFVRVRRSDWDLVIDAGGPGPKFNPGHAHAGALGFELSWGPQALAVDTGVSTYSGIRRSYERSAAAHNVIVVDGQDPFRMWGGFRAARLSKTRIVAARDEGHGCVVVAESEFGNNHRAFLHRRTWNISAGRVTVEDEVQGSGRHGLCWWLHLAPFVDAVRLSDRAVDLGAVWLQLGWDGAMRMVCWDQDVAHGVSDGIGRGVVPAAAVSLEGCGDLPSRVKAEFVAK